jgi:uncharacterized protein
MTAPNIETLRTETPTLFDLVDLCKQELGATEVWLFGSRARGDHEENSNWNVMALLPDDVSEEINNPITLLKVRRKVDLAVDLLAVEQEFFYEADDEEGCFAHTIKTEGIRLDA